MSVVWTKTKETRNGNQVRQSYTAAVADGLLVREVLLLDEGTSSFSSISSPRRVREYAEAMCFIPTAEGAPAAWASESQAKAGEREDDLYSSALATGKLYLSISIISDADGQGNSASKGAPKMIHMSLAYMS